MKTSVKSILAIAIGMVIPAIILGILIENYRVDVPYRDELGMVRNFEAIESGELSGMKLLSARHNEHPSATLFAVTWANAKFNGGRTSDLCWITFLLLLGIAGSLIFLLRKNSGVNPPVMVQFFITLLVSGTVMTAAQFSNLLWGMQFALVLPVFLTIAAVFVLRTSRIPGWLGLILALLFGGIATVTNASGMALWPSVLVFLIFAAEGSGVRKWLRPGLWFFAMLAAALFFSKAGKAGLPETGGESKIASMVADPGAAISYFLAFLSSPWADTFSIRAGLQAPFIGSVILIGIGFIVVSAILKIDVENRRNIAAWLSFITFGLVIGALITVGRFQIGPEQATSGRYVSWAAFLIASVIGLTVSIRPVFFKKRPAVSGAVLGAIGLLTLMSWVSGFEKMRSRRSENLACKAIAHFPIQEPDVLGFMLYPAEILPGILDQWQANELLRPNRLSPDVTNVSAVKRHKNPLPGSYGNFESVEKTSAGNVVASGTGVALDFTRPMDLVVLTDQRGEFLKFVIPGEAERKTRIFREYTSKRYKRDHAGWEVTIPAGKITPNVTGIQAWAYDAESEKLYRYREEYKIPE